MSLESIKAAVKAVYPDAEFRVDKAASLIMATKNGEWQEIGYSTTDEYRAWVNAHGRLMEGK